MAISTLDDFKRYARSHLGRIDISTASSASLTPEIVEQFLDDAEARLQLQWSCSASDLTGDVRRLFVNLECLTALRSIFVGIAVDTQIIMVIDSEIQQISKVMLPAPSIISESIDTAFETPDYLKKDYTDD